MVLVSGVTNNQIGNGFKARIKNCVLGTGNDNEDQNSDSKWFENRLFKKYLLRILNHQINDVYFWAFKVSMKGFLY